ncbi:unnamed protein product [Strongylus vulgaris]|uniref:K Homology domain-containing protein n=1 Tax=Strongylus vulgaris TaxID=40348 RepID=A0A3P7IKY7_STRVU|nr:unnamed protein product [Strongylus vulgaris]
MSIVVTGPPSPPWQPALSRSEHLSSLNFVHCGQLLSQDVNALGGFGTRTTLNGLLATVSGLKSRYNKLYIVTPYKAKYRPKTADFMIGRVTSIRRAIWKLDINYRFPAILHLNNMILPSGELRRKNLDDEIAMRDYLTVGDLLSAEVQHVRNKGEVELHTGHVSVAKCGQGILLRVWPDLVRSQKKHICEIYGIQIVIADNGFVWISSKAMAEAKGDYVEDITLAKRRSILRIAACVRLLGKRWINISENTILFAYKLSLSYKIREIAYPDVSLSLISELRNCEHSERENCQGYHTSEA